MLTLKYNRSQTGISMFILSICFFIFRTSFPLFKWFFGISYLSTIVLMLPLIFSQYRKGLFEFFKHFLLPAIIGLIYVLSVLNTNQVYKGIFLDYINLFILFSFFFLATILYSAFPNIYRNQLFDKSIFIFFSFGSILSVYEIFNFFLELKGIYITQFFNSGIVYRDYNFSTIPIFFSLVISLFHNLRFLKRNWLLITLYTIYIFSLFLTGSRRGMIVYIITLSLLICISFFDYIKGNRDENVLKLKKILCLTVSTAILILSIYIFYFHTSPLNKVAILKSCNISINHKNKTKIINPIHKFLSLYKKTTIEENYIRFWHIEFNSNNPNSGWGKGNYRTVYPLKGKNVNILPQDAVGYLMDRDRDAHSWDSNAISYTLFKSIPVSKGDSICFSAYCYVSEDFNGTYARIKTEGALVLSDYYNLEQRGKWQLLKICSKINEPGNIKNYLYWALYDATDFSNLTGHIIYAYPQVKLIQADSSTLFKKTSSEKNTNHNISNNGFYLTNNILARIPLIFQVSNRFYLTILKKLPKFFSTNYIKPVIQSSNIDNNSFYSSRTNRWKYALELYINHYTPLEKLIGNGFDYIYKYGERFYNTKDKADWPHNPFLSVLLYSGIIGLLIYFYLISRVIYLYVKYLKKYPIYFIFFSITFFFSFFSANAPFNPPVMGFFVLLPFFINFAHKRSDQKV